MSRESGMGGAAADRLTLVLAVIGAVALAAGGAYAGIKIGKGAVKTKNIANKAVKSKKIAPNAVQGGHIADGAIDTLDLAPSAVNAAKIAEDAVGGPEIAEDSVGGSELADGAVEAANLAAGAVPVPPIRSGLVIRADAVATSANATEHTLLERGSFKVVGKCFRTSTSDSSTIYAQTKLVSNQNGAVARGTPDNASGDTPEGGYLDAGEGLAIGQSSAVSPGNTDVMTGSGTGIFGDQAFHVGLVAFIKNAPLSTGSGTYGDAATSDRCIFHAYEIGEG